MEDLTAMMSPIKITPEHLARRAIVYVRQSSPTQVLHNLESQRRQYELAQQARQLGFTEVDTIDEDLGCSAAGQQQRPGFDRLVAEVCGGEVGAVFCLEASRLARNGRDWHHLIDFCGLVHTLVIDAETVYDPRLVNDRLLLGLKGTMNEYELSLLQQRTREAIRQKAQRGELQFCLPVGLLWTAAGKIDLDPDERVRQTLNLVFEKFAELDSARQVQMWLLREKISLPAWSEEGMGRCVHFQPPLYSAVLSQLKNPLYAGAYVWGRTTSRTVVVEGRARKTAGHDKPQTQWTVLLCGHHPGYISWEQFERNQAVLADNTNMKSRMHPRTGRGGHGLLAGLLRCGRCGRRLNVVYGGRQGNVPRYECRGAKGHLGLSRCQFFSGMRVDGAVGNEILRVVEEPAIEAALEAAARVERQDRDRERAIVLELEQAQYEARLAERRYEAVDPDKRLVASELEARWNAALTHVQDVRRKLSEARRETPGIEIPDKETLLALAQDVPTIWNDAVSDMRLKQRIARILIEEIVVDVAGDGRKVILTIHWSGGRHSELEVEKRATGRHGQSTDLEAVEVVRQMAGQYQDRQIAATLNRLGLKTGAGNTWTESRIRALRSHQKLPRYDANWGCEGALTIEQAADILGISASSVRQLILQSKVLPATQVIAYAPWRIARESLELAAVKQAVEQIKNRIHSPRCEDLGETLSLFSIT
jgi:DNA invertase Pin-like site-specific DNA recombinase